MDLHDQFLHATDEEVDDVCDSESVVPMKAMIYARHARAESSAVLLEVAQAENARLKESNTWLYEQVAEGAAENARLHDELDAGANAHGAPRPGVDVWRFCAAAEVANGRLRCALRSLLEAIDCSPGAIDWQEHAPEYEAARAALSECASKDPR